MEKNRILTRLAILALVCGVHAVPVPVHAGPVQPEDVLSTRYAINATVSPDGEWIAFRVSVPRETDEPPGARHVELHVLSTRTGESRTYLGAPVSVSAVAWRPGHREISFLMRRGGKKATVQVWSIPVDGGEARRLTHSPTPVYAYAWHPGGERLAYTAVREKTAREKKLDELGYGFEYFEENVRGRNLYLLDVPDDDAGTPARLATDALSVWDVAFDPGGGRIALAASDENLIDQKYFRRVYLYDVETGAITPFTENEGKLGTFVFSPDGKTMAYTAALNRHDHAVSQVYVKSLEGGPARNLTEPEFAGHVHWAGWIGNRTVVYRASEGVWKTLSTVPAKGGRRSVILDGEKLGFGFDDPSYTPDFNHVAFTASSPEMPRDVYYWKGKGEPRRMTELNPWVAGRDLGRCEVVRYAARDGWPVEGLLYYPVGYEAGTRYPLAVIVHGGPESHFPWSWRSAYQRPVEVLTGRGYVVFLPNYRGSTGYGLAHTRAHQGDPAGVEFDDIADGIRHLTDIGLADPERVGLSGGSYGGFAAAWFATYYTDLVKASVMFVGLSNLISKRGTSDIPYEELWVHSIDPLEDMWQKSLERSPIYWAHQSRTATLIIGGDSDTRVHPSQSLELFRRMKMNGHPAVRLVRYPGEKHGNRRMPGRRDVLYRTLQWYDWFVKDGRPLDGGMPDPDISDLYPIELPGKGETQKPEEKAGALP